MNTSYLARHIRLLASITLTMPIAVLLLSYFDLPVWPLNLAFGAFCAEATRRFQQRQYPELNCSWFEIFRTVTSEDIGANSDPELVIDRYLGSLTETALSISHAEAIIRVKNYLPRETVDSIINGLKQFEAMVGVDRHGIPAETIMKNRAEYPEFVLASIAGEIRTFNDSIIFCRLLTDAPNIIIRIIIIGEAIAKMDRGDEQSKLKLLDGLKKYHSEFNRDQIRRYLATLPPYKSTPPKALTI